MLVSPFYVTSPWRHPAAVLIVIWIHGQLSLNDFYDWITFALGIILLFLDLRLGRRMDFSVCPILRPNILGHILFK